MHEGTDSRTGFWGVTSQHRSGTVNRLYLPQVQVHFENSTSKCSDVGVS